MIPASRADTSTYAWSTLGSGKVYCEMYVSDADGALLLGVHGASLSNTYVGPGNANTLGEYASVGQYALAFDTGTGDLWAGEHCGRWPAP